MNLLNYLSLNYKINITFVAVSESSYLKDNVCFFTYKPGVSKLPLYQY